MHDTNIQLIFTFIDHERCKGYDDKTLQKKEYTLLHFYAYTGKSFSAVTEKDVVKYLEILEHRQSFNRKLGYIRQFYTFLVEEDKVLLHPALKIKPLSRNHHDQYDIFTIEEIKAILETTTNTPVGKRDRAIIELMYSTGIRVSECVGLDVDDFNARHRELFVFRGKGGKERVVPVGYAALFAVEKYLRVRERFLDCSKEPDALFLSTHGYRLSVSSLREMIRRRKQNAGIDKPGTCHALRHTCASHLLKNGAPIALIGRILGHERLRATELYVHITLEDQKERKDDA